MKVLLAHPGTQHSHYLARELDRHQLLGTFWTGLGFAENSAAAALSRFLCLMPGLGGLGSRIVRDVSLNKIHSTPLIELRALLRLRRRHDSLAVLHQRNADFQEAIPDYALAQSNAVIGFDTSSWQLAHRCVQQAKPFYLDRTIAHPSALDSLLRELAQTYPEWTGIITPRPAFLVEAEKIEHACAHRIVVGGSFARKTLVDEGIAPERITVNNYGVDWGRFSASDGIPSGRPFRFLYVGSVIARKGVPILLKAWRALAPRDAELWIAGSIGPGERKLIPELPGLRLLGQIAGAEMAGIYASCDVFVLPSIFEGFGLVILEALAAGLPVISTPHTGAIDAVSESSLGQIVPVFSVEALVEAMRHYIRTPPQRALVVASTAALQERFSWRAYGDRWATLLKEG